VNINSVSEGTAFDDAESYMFCSKPTVRLFCCIRLASEPQSSMYELIYSNAASILLIAGALVFIVSNYNNAV
jgi:hypothetical protein